VPEKQTAPGAIKGVLADETPAVAVKGPAVKLIRLSEWGAGLCTNHGRGAFKARLDLRVGIANR